MKRCPKCAEKVQSAATVCRYCAHQFVRQDAWGEASDEVDRVVKWIGKVAVTIVLCWLAYACVRGAAMDQAQPHANLVGQNLF